jgi:DNA-binding NarL/FixJ family response regulator
MAYADDVTIFVTRPEDFETIREVIRTYEQAAGVLLNPEKSKALAVAGWATVPEALGIDLYDRITILGVEFTHYTNLTAKHNWDKVIAAVRAQARAVYDRHLTWGQRLQYIQRYLMAKIWYLAQILPQTRAQAQRLTTACSWFLWKGAIFRVPQTTLQLPKDKGGWGSLEWKPSAAPYCTIG